jgi:hypothetical protein
MQHICFVIYQWIQYNTIFILLKCFRIQSSFVFSVGRIFFCTRYGVCFYSPFPHPCVHLQTYFVIDTSSPFLMPVLAIGNIWFYFWKEIWKNQVTETIPYFKVHKSTLLMTQPSVPSPQNFFLSPPIRGVSRGSRTQTYVTVLAQVFHGVSCCRGEAVQVPLAGVRVAIRPFGRVDSSLPETHRSEAVQVCGLRPVLRAVRPPCAAYEEAPPQGAQVTTVT